MKKIRMFLFSMIFILSSGISVPANVTPGTIIIKTFKDGSYIESTTLENTGASLRSTAHKKTGHKTNTYRNRSGRIIWSVTVRGSYTFNGKKFVCTNASVSVSCRRNGWKIANSSSKKAGATASAFASVKKYMGGKCIKTISRTVKLTCSKNGKLS